MASIVRAALCLTVLLAATTLPTQASHADVAGDPYRALRLSISIQSWSGGTHVMAYVDDGFAGGGMKTLQLSRDGVVLAEAFNGTPYTVGVTVPPLAPDACHRFEAYGDTYSGLWHEARLSFGNCGQAPDPDASGFFEPDTLQMLAHPVSGPVFDMHVHLRDYDTQWMQASLSLDPGHPQVHTYRYLGGYYADFLAQGYPVTYCGAMTIDGLAYLGHEGEGEGEGEGASPHARDLYVRVERDGSDCEPYLNTAPTVDAGNDDWQLPAHRPLQFVAHVDDPDEGDSHTATIDWGDGSSEAAAVVDGVIQAEHWYHARGSWTITVCVEDAAGEQDCDARVHTQRGAHGEPHGKNPGKP